MRLKGEFYVFLSAAGFALMPIFAKLAYGGGASVTTVLLLRFLSASIFMWVYVLLKKIEFRITLKQIISIFVLGSICYSGSALTLFNSYKFISAGFSEVLMFTYPVWVLIILRIKSNEKIGFYKLFAIILSILGILVSSYSPNQFISFKGTVLALLGAVFYSLYVAFIDDKRFEGIHPAVMTAYILPSVTITYLIYGLIKGGIAFQFSPWAWTNTMLLGLFSTSIPVLAFCTGAKLIGSSRASIISTIEPFLSFIFGYFILGEKFSWNMALGGVLILIAVFMIHRFSGVKEK